MPMKTSDLANQIIEGDSLKILPQIEDNTIDSVVTSPPYFADKEYETLKKTSDNMLDNYQKYLYELLIPVFLECYRILKPGGHLWLNIDDVHTSIKSVLKKNIVLPTHALLLAELSKHYDYKEMILWRKIRGKHSSGGANRMLGSYGRFRSPGSIPIVQEVEYILWFRKPGDRDDVTDDRRKESALTPKQFRQFGMQVWDIDAERDKSILHPAPYPIEIPRRCILLSSFKNDLILDPFMGAGSTGIAAINTGRKYVGIELNRKYADRARTRIKYETSNIFN
jgi:DNA modification methylase